MHVGLNDHNERNIKAAYFTLLVSLTLAKPYPSGSEVAGPSLGLLPFLPGVISVKIKMGTLPLQKEPSNHLCRLLLALR